MSVRFATVLPALVLGKRVEWSGLPAWTQASRSGQRRAGSCGFACNTHRLPVGVTKSTHVSNVHGEGLKSLELKKVWETKIAFTSLQQQNTPSACKLGRTNSLAQSKGKENTDNLLWDWLHPQAWVSLPLRLAGLFRALSGCQDQEGTQRISDKEGFVICTQGGLSESPDAGSATGLQELGSYWAAPLAQPGLMFPSLCLALPLGHNSSHPRTPLSDLRVQSTNAI